MIIIMEQLPFITKPEIFNIPFKLNTEIEEVDLNWIESDTICYFYSPDRKSKKRRSKKIKIDRKVKLEEAGIYHYPRYGSVDKSLISH